MIRRPPRSKRTDTLFPHTARVRSRSETMEHEVTAPLTDLNIHHRPRDLSDRIAFGITKALRWSADTLFAERYGHRAVVLETVAAVPGMVGATLRSEEHTSELQSLMRISYAVICMNRKNVQHY